MELFLILTLPLIASGASFFLASNIRSLGLIAIAATTLELVMSGRIAAMLNTGSPYALTRYLNVDHFGAILLLLLSFGGLMASIYARGYLGEEMSKASIGFNRAKKLYAQLHLFLLAMTIAIATTNPILAWIAVEATTLTTAFLISFYNKPDAMEAAWKYLILNSVGLLFAFFGTLLFLTPELHSGATSLATWQSLLESAGTYNPFILKMAFLFVLIGYGTKVGLVPMHTWLPDAHSKAPSPVSSLLSGVLLNVPLLAILRFKTITDSVLGTDYSSTLLIAFGLLSLIVSAVIILVQKNYKRLLAYSSIEHMGIITLGFGFGGAALAAALLHLIYHSMTKSLLFLSAGNIYLAYDSTEIKNVRDLATTLPKTAALFFFGTLTIMGMPPMGIFFTELTILSAGTGRYLWIVIAALSALILVGVGFIRHVAAMEFGQTDRPTHKIKQEIWTTLPLVILTGAIIFLSVATPGVVRTFIETAVRSL